MRNLLTELVKLLLVVFTTLLTIWASDYFVRRRRVETYRELLYKERLQIYRDLWTRYVSITRSLGNKGAALSVQGLRELLEQNRARHGQLISDRASSSPVGPVSSRDITGLLDEIDGFIAFARGVYIVLDTDTVATLEGAIRVIEGKVQREPTVINWSELHKRSQDLQDAIRRELGIDKLRELEAILRSS
jgi:hypothetical protein